MLHWHPALLASDPTFLLRRLAVNSEEDHPIKVKLYRPSKPSYNARQPWKTINLSELGPSISNPTSLSPPTSDLVKCADITEPFILYNLISRFETDSIYTSIGDIMIAINPFRSIPNLHSDTVMDSFKNLTDVQRIEASPHVFNIASTALAGLTAHNVMQVRAQLKWNQEQELRRTSRPVVSTSAWHTSAWHTSVWHTSVCPLAHTCTRP